MLTEEQVNEEIKRLEALQRKYYAQLQDAVKASSTIAIMGLCDSLNMTYARINGLKFVLGKES